jgi:hypothetical protein
MKISQDVLICAAMALLAVPTLGAQDLSKYRNFSLGSTLAVVAKEAQVPLDQVTTVHQSPALLQQLTLWPEDSSDAQGGSEDVREMQLSFCNGELYNITVVYKTSATQGLTDDQLIQAISSKYGVAARPAAATNPPALLSSNSADQQLASWQNSQYSAALSRSPLSRSFQLVLLSKKLQAQADAATTEAVAQEQEDAPQREAALAKKEAEDQQAQSDANLKAFRP